MSSPSRPTVPSGPGSVAGDLLLMAVGFRGAVLTRGPLAPVVAAGGLVDDLLAGALTWAPVPGRADVVRQLRRNARQRLGVTVDAVVAAGAGERHRAWARPPRRCGLAVVDHAAVARARQRVAEALTGPSDGRSDAAVAALSCTSGLARYCVRLLDDASRERVRRRVVGSAAVLGEGPVQVVMALRVLLGRDGVPPAGAAPVLLPSEDRDGYGDQGGADSYVGGPSAGRDATAQPWGGGEVGWGGGFGGGEGG